MDADRKWLNQFNKWRCGDSGAEKIALLLKRQRKIGLNPEIVRSSLKSLHRSIDSEFLDLTYLPIDLLLTPDAWNPLSIGIDSLALLDANNDLTTPADLVRSGCMNAILKGERQLYNTLPALPIKAYWNSLRPGHRTLCRKQNLSAFEHLSCIGWQHFVDDRPLAHGLDHYRESTATSFSCAQSSTEQQCSACLIVLEATLERARELAVQGGWPMVRSCQFGSLDQLWTDLRKQGIDLISICHASDALAAHAYRSIAQCSGDHPSATFLTSDELILWGSGQSGPLGHRQNRVAVTPFRLLTRGAIGGLITVRMDLLDALDWDSDYCSVHALGLDLAFQALAQQQPVAHCPEPLVFRNCRKNPTVAEQCWPMQRNNFSNRQRQCITAITQKHAQALMHPGGLVIPEPGRAGCHRVQTQNSVPALVSILIPFRDKQSLTQKCIQSIQAYASSTVPYEIILIDNGSQGEDTRAWIDSVQNEKIRCLRIDSPFNFSRLNNIASRHSNGDYLLFLNNDIEFQSHNVLDQLMEPFAFHKTGAVGSRLHYPDGTIQHSGVMIVTGERRCVQEPGKHLGEASVIQSLTPLMQQEEYSAASAACLMVKKESFDAIGGFDEQLEVVFNDVDLCLRLRERGECTVITPYPKIIHHESISRGNDLEGDAYARHQRESGLLREKHSILFSEGDPLCSQNLHSHSTRYEPRPDGPKPVRAAKEQILYAWMRRKNWFDPKKMILILAQYSDDSIQGIRPDLIQLLKEYRKYCNVIVVASSPFFLQQEDVLSQLKHVSDGLIIRRNEGYDFGSWMTGLSYFKDIIKESKHLILTNDSLWGPIQPLEDLFEKIKKSSDDIIGLVDNLMFRPHLSSAFLAYNKNVISSQLFWDFWGDIQIWEKKRDLVKQYEVGWSCSLRDAGYQLSSLYSQNANGNIYHTEWKNLIVNKKFPFLKVSLLRDNPWKQDVHDWYDIVRERNPTLSQQILNQLPK